MHKRFKWLVLLLVIFAAIGVVTATTQISLDSPATLSQRYLT